MITPPFAPEILAEFPELTALGRTATRLHPRRATSGVPGAGSGAGSGAGFWGPGAASRAAGAPFGVADAGAPHAARVPDAAVHPPRAGDSHVGGPLAWPADEPWPLCTHELRDGRPHARPNPLIPLAQLWASDVPDLPRTDPHGDTFDVLQVLWCPVEHLRDTAGPAVQIRRRRAADLPTDLLTDPPQGDVQHAGWLPTPCLLHPEQVTDYPCADALPPALRDRMPPGVAAGFVAPGWKVGGYPRRPGGFPCPHCGTPSELLLVISDHEYDDESFHWIPLEEQDLDWSAPDGDAHQRPTGLRLTTDVHLFTCPGCGATHVS
ncbi:hypothetical protein [Dactylosporangium maewongense]